MTGSEQVRAGGTTGTTPVDHDEIAREMAAHPAKKGMPFNIGLTVFEIAGTLLAFHFAKQAGLGNVGAYLVGTIPPIVGAGVVWLRARKFSGASAAIFAFAVLSAVVALIGSTDEKVLLYKDCAVTAAVALIFAGSCLFRRPLTFYFAQRFGSDGTHEGMAVFDKMWVAYDNFRRTMYLITAVWAVSFLVEAAVMVVIIATLSFDTAYDFDQVLPLVATGVGIAGSIILGNRSRRHGEAMRAAAQQGAAPA